MGTIDATRLLDGLRTLRSHGAVGTGVVRPTFSDADMAAREWLRARMASIGLEARVDGVGNVVGRSPNDGPALLLGSHADTQPEGGWLDGAMGVMDAIEVAETLLTDPATHHLAIDVVAWSDEEGTYTSCLGSRSFVGSLTDADLESRNAAGETVRAAIRRVGLDGVPAARLDRRRHVGYLEAHIEQGPHLEERGLRIGVVTSIVGIRGVRVMFDGQQNHAGTTPMDRRKDAGVALFRFAHLLQERLRAVAGPTSVWTIGDARLEPGAASIVPGAASLILQLRDPSADTLDAMDDAVRALATELDATGPVGVDARPDRHSIAPTVMDPDLRRHLAAAAAAHVPDGWIEMPSAAGHDPMVLSDHLPCGMLFIPSIGGVSHDFAEDSTDDDIALGCQVLADATASILSGAHDRHVG